MIAIKDQLEMIFNRCLCLSESVADEPWSRCTYRRILFIFILKTWSAGSHSTTGGIRGDLNRWPHWWTHDHTHTHAGISHGFCWDQMFRAVYGKYDSSVCQAGCDGHSVDVMWLTCAALWCLFLEQEVISATSTQTHTHTDWTHSHSHP